MKLKLSFTNLLRLATITLVVVLLRGAVAFSDPAINDLTVGERVTFYSQVLDEDRTVLVGLPKGYLESQARYPVLYVLDGEFFFHQAHAAVQFLSECTYIRTPPIPQMLVVGIVNVDRNRDCTPNHAPVQGNLRYPTSGGAGKFLEHVQSELIPLIDGEYRTQPYSVVAGWSFGGLFTVHTWLHNPGAFSSYLAISPSLWWDGDSPVEEAESALAEGSVSSKRLVVTLGALEGGDMGRSVRSGFVPLFKSDLSDGSAFEFIEIAEREHYFGPWVAFYDGLAALFDDWALPQNRLSGGIESVRAFYEDLSTRVNYTVQIPESAYQALVGSLISKGDDQAALEMARLAVDKYPASSRAHRTLGNVLWRIGDDAAARTRFELAIEVEKQLAEPDSERIMDVWLMLWLLDQEANATESNSN
jgi:predicted alpha/beta superfamily hydrolase